MSRKVIVLMVSILLAAGMSLFAAGSQDGSGSSASVPEIHHYEPQTNAAGSELGSDPDVYAAVQDYIETQTGVRPINHYLSKDDYNTALNLVLSSGEQVDWFYNSNWTNFYTKGIIQPINDYLKFTPVMQKTWPEESWRAITGPDGKVWGMPRATPTTPWYVHIRQDWLDTLGLDMPTTVEELENVMEAFLQAKLNGENNTTVLLFSNGVDGLRRAFLANWNEYGDSMFLDTDGKVKPYVLSKGYTDWVRTMARWYQLGYLDQESFVNSRATRSRYQQLQPGVFAGWYSHVTISDEVLKKTAPEAKYVIAPIMGPDGKGIMSVNGAKPTNGQLFHINNSDMEATMKMIEWFFLSEENYLTGEWGLKGQQWEWVDEAKKIYKPIGDRKLFNDFRYSVGLPMEAKVMAEGGFVMHNDYLRNKLLNYDMAVFPWDAPYNWDSQAANENIPGLGDINRLMKEESTKFIMGARPLSEADDFLQELYAAGLDKWIEEYTRQYNMLK